MKLNQILLLAILFLWACTNTPPVPTEISEEMAAYEKNASQSNAQQLINKVFYTLSQENSDAMKNAELLSIAADASSDHGKYAEATSYLNLGLRNMPEGEARIAYTHKLYDLFNDNLKDSITSRTIAFAISKKYPNNPVNFQGTNKLEFGDMDAYLTNLKETTFTSATQIDRTKVFEFINSAEVNGVISPESESAPSWIFQAGDMSRNMGQYQKAISLYDWILAEYPNHEKAGKALFLKAFTIDENLGKKQDAKILYETFVQQYPDDDFAESAAFLLENINKTNEEIIDDILKK